MSLAFLCFVEVRTRVRRRRGACRGHGTHTVAIRSDECRHPCPATQPVMIGRKTLVPSRYPSRCSSTSAAALSLLLCPHMFLGATATPAAMGSTQKGPCCQYLRSRGSKCSPSKGVLAGFLRVASMMANFHSFPSLVCSVVLRWEKIAAAT